MLLLLHSVHTQCFIAPIILGRTRTDKLDMKLGYRLWRKESRFTGRLVEIVGIAVIIVAEVLRCLRGNGRRRWRQSRGGSRCSGIHVLLEDSLRVVLATVHNADVVDIFFPPLSPIQDVVVEIACLFAVGRAASRGAYGEIRTRHSYSSHRRGCGGQRTTNCHP